MKVKFFIVYFVIAYTLMPSTAHAFNISLNICEYIAADDKKRLRKLLKQNRLKLRKLFSDIKCNADNLLIFAAKRKSMDIGELLVKKLPKGVLKENLTEAESLSPDIANLIKERIK